LNVLARNEAIFISRKATTIAKYATKNFVPWRLCGKKFKEFKKFKRLNELKKFIKFNVFARNEAIFISRKATTIAKYAAKTFGPYRFVAKNSNV